MATNGQTSGIKIALKQLIREVLAESFSGFGETQVTSRRQARNIGGELEQPIRRRRRRRKGFGKGRVTDPTTDKRVKKNRVNDEE